MTRTDVSAGQNEFDLRGFHDEYSLSCWKALHRIEVGVNALKEFGDSSAADPGDRTAKHAVTMAVRTRARA
jgi:hypothetical protein